MTIRASNYSVALSNRRLSNSSSIQNERLIDKQRPTTPPPSIEANNKDYRQKITNDILDGIKKHMDSSVNFEQQQNNLASLILCLSAVLHNRTNYRIFKDINLDEISDGIAVYVSNHIPNLLYLKKSAKNIACDLIKICDMPKLPLSFGLVVDKMFKLVCFELVNEAYNDEPKLTKYAKEIVDATEKPSIYRVNLEYVRRDLIKKFTGYSREATSVLFHIWNMKNLDLNKASCTAVNFSYIPLQDLTINEADFSHTNFRYATLINVTFTNCDFRLAHFDEAILKNVIMDNCRLEGATFTHALINDSEISIQIPRDLVNSEIGGDRITERFLQHKHEDKNCVFNNYYSILTTIDSIQNIYAELKVKLMNQVINGIWKNSVWRHIDFFRHDYYTIASFVDIIMQDNSIYIQDSNIQDFMLNAVLKTKFNMANIIVHKFTKHEVILLLNDIVQNIENNSNVTKDSKNSRNGRNNNNSKINYLEKVLTNINGINQLLYWAGEYAQQDSSIKQNYKVLHKVFFGGLDLLAKYKKYISDGNEYYMFVNKDGKEFVFLNHDDFGNLVYKKNYESLSWDRIMYSKDSSSFHYLKHKVDEVFSTFRLLNSRYTRYKKYINRSVFTKYLTTKDLGEYQKLFIESRKIMLLDIENGPDTNKLKDDSKIDFTIDDTNIDKLHAIKLANIFGKFVEGGIDKIYSSGFNIMDITITQEDYIKTMESFKVDPNDYKKAAMLLFCLATVYAQYSSWNYFGNKFDSPIAIRNYALALLNTAIKTYSEIFDIERMKNFRDTFSGTNRKTIYTREDDNREDTCTATLSNMMANYIKENTDKSWYELLRVAAPTGWYK